MTDSFKVLSLSYKKASVEIRELLALDEGACAALLHDLQHNLGLADVLVLSTCNRTEVYYSAAENQRAGIIAAFSGVKGVGNVALYEGYFVERVGMAAAQHLFEVALGLDAQVVGDVQISSQVKRAYQRSAAAGAAGPTLHRLVQAVLAANKRVQQETYFRDGAASTSYATLELVKELTAAVASPRVLIVGLGEIGADVGRHFGKCPRFADVAICNRTAAVAATLAAECGLRVLDFADLLHGVQEADVIISALGAPTPFFTRELLAGLQVQQPKFFIDLSVPRSVEAAAEQVPGVFVYNIDAIALKASAALARRVEALPQVRAIIADALAALHERGEQLRVSPTIHKLKTTLEHLRQQELSRYHKDLSPAEVHRLDAVTRTLTQKFLKLPVLQLKAACRRGDADAWAAMLTEVFDLK